MCSSPYFDPTRCDRCGLCVPACPCHAVSLTEEGVAFACDACCIHDPACPTLRHCLWPCEEACPHGAIQSAFGLVIPDDEAAAAQA